MRLTFHVKQRALGRDPCTPGVARRARLDLLQHGVMGVVEGSSVGKLQAQGRQSVAGPALRRLIRRLAHDQPASHLQQGSGTLGRHRRRPEPPGDHQPVPPTVTRIPPDVLGPGDEHADPLAQPEALDGLGQEDATALAAVQQHPPARGVGDGQHQPREPTARPQVHRRRQCLAHGVRVGKAQGVGQVRFERPRPQQAPPPALVENFE